jgi:TetR/AcrR family transcriptional regulator, regulator of cefoperazone and chloramphenicol sensitivity
MASTPPSADPQSSARRRPAEGGYARGEETRARIVAAALKVFGEEGFEQASTRRIAAEAGVTPPALQYHFDSKEGLHLACGQLLADRILARLEAPLAGAARALEAGEPAGAAEALCSLMECLIEHSAASDKTSGWGRFLARADAEGAGPALPLVRKAVFGPLLKTCIALTATATGAAPDDERVRLKTLLLMGQLSPFGAGRANTLAAMGWTELDAPRLAAVKRVLRENVFAALGAQVPD